MLLAGVVGLWVLGPGIGVDLVALLRGQFRGGVPAELGVSEAREMFTAQLTQFLRIGLPLMAIPLFAGLLAGFGQTGFNLTLNRLSPDVERLSPTSGASRLFSMAGV